MDSGEFSKAKPWKISKKRDRATENNCPISYFLGAIGIAEKGYSSEGKSGGRCGQVRWHGRKEHNDLDYYHGREKHRKTQKKNVG